MVPSTRGLSSAMLPVAVSATVLLGVTSWQLYTHLTAKPTNPAQQTASANGTAPIASDTNTIDASSTFSINTQSNADNNTGTSSLTDLGNSVVNSIAGAYKELSDANSLSDDSIAQKGTELAKKITPEIQTRVYGADDVAITMDSSKERALQYRSDLQTSLAPLLAISGPEFETFARYTESKNPEFLQRLSDDANRYRAAIKQTLALTVPLDARDLHLGILNSMQQFAATLDAMVNHAQDPFASGVLLKNYNQGEADIVDAYGKLAEYFRAKVK